MVYHSALKDELDVDGELSYFENNGNIVFEWDITQGVHKLFYNADALYCEPSWQHGYQKFLDRAGQGGNSTFPQYLSALKAIISELSIPSYVILGKHMLKFFNPYGMTDINIHGYGALVGVWNVETPKVIDTAELVKLVCGNFEIVLDPCCGYGMVVQYAKKFICSDINRKCIYYVAKEFMGYEG